jgi:hypothetical protein
MKSRIEQDHEQYRDFALIPPRRSVCAATASNEGKGAHSRGS